jgi:hypothetical protein
MHDLLFPALLLGHMIGDWVLQSDYMAANKFDSVAARAWHVLVYPATVFFVSCWFVPDGFLLTLAIWMLASHFVIDSRRWRTSAPLFVQIVADQTLHFAALFLFIVWVGGAA